MINPNIMLKCIVIGNLSVGKTSIILRYTKNTFAGQYIPTIGADFTTTSLKIDENYEMVDLQGKDNYILENLHLTYEEFTLLNDQFDEDTKIYLWDLAGQPFFRKIRNYYMSHAFMALTVFDLNKPPYDISGWLNDLKTFSPHSDFLLVGNKSDLIDSEESNLKEQIASLEQRHDSKVHLVSAKSAEGVRGLFIEMKINMMKRLVPTS
ncbi:MAG: GTP-binding protein [Candidatus Lokiarchaeota archaeon]|nr:GTP-binding protein [Candidatus Lokiarchaeota archaeon]